MFSSFLVRTLTDSTFHNGCGMSTRPAFYSGRGATSSDLSSEKLFRVNTAIRNNRGEDASKAFVAMIAAIPVLSATDFLIALSALEQNDWKWDVRLLGSQNGVYATDRDEALATVLTVAAGRREQHDETVSIRAAFLRHHGVKDPKAKDSHYGPYGYPY